MIQKACKRVKNNTLAFIERQCRSPYYMQQNTNVHHAFASYFAKDDLYPFLYQLSRKMAEGNVCLYVNEVAEEDGPALPDPEILNRHELVGNPEALRPFILFEDRLYLHRFFHYERKFVAQVNALLHREQTYYQSRHDFLVQQEELIVSQLFPESKGSTPDWQLIACLNSFLNQFSIISGGPGTGKTTTVVKLLALFLLEQPDAKIKICAPTGKAKVRLEEGLRKAKRTFQHTSIPEHIADTIATLQAATIHSLLGYIPGSIHFKHHALHTLEADILIVDESSMVDMALFHKLMQAVDTNRTRVILLGDKHQLASVDAGSVFRDLCSEEEYINHFDPERAALLNQFVIDPTRQLDAAYQSENSSYPLFQHIVELQHSYRFDDQKGIGKLSKAVLHYDEMAIRDFAETPAAEVGIYPASTLQDWLQEFAALLKKEQGGYIGQRDITTALERITGSTILCAVKEGRTGVAALNEQVTRLLFHPDEVFYEERLIMVLQNQPQEGIYNGDMGIVRKDNAEKNELKVFFPQSDTGYESLSPAQILSCDSAYAMTIHKSQGSEFDSVLIVLPEQTDHQLLTRELLYTAITRARKRVIIVGDIDIVLAASAHTVRRISGIQQQFAAV